MTDDVHNPAVNWYGFHHHDGLVAAGCVLPGYRWSMPTYEYMCKKCGPFTQLRAMAECDLPSACPECGARSPRVILTAPSCLTMSAEARQQGIKYERIIERYDGHEPLHTCALLDRPRKRHVPQGEESVSVSLTESPVASPLKHRRAASGTCAGAMLGGPDRVAALAFHPHFGLPVLPSCMIAHEDSNEGDSQPLSALGHDRQNSV